MPVKGKDCLLGAKNAYAGQKFPCGAQCLWGEEITYWGKMPIRGNMPVGGMPTRNMIAVRGEQKPGRGYGLQRAECLDEGKEQVRGKLPNRGKIIVKGG